MEMEHPSLRKFSSYCLERVPVYVHSSLFRALKLKFLMDVRGLSRDILITTELGTGSLKHAISILTLKDFKALVDTMLVSELEWL